MKRLFLRLIGVFLLLALSAVALIAVMFKAKSGKTYPAPAFTIADEVKKADVALGHRIYAVRAGCIECHGANLAGAPIMDNGPMGSIHGANITPAQLRDWTDEQIATAIRYGIHRDGRTLRFMPSFDYAGLSKGDIAAVIAYLRSMPPVDQPSHANTFGPVARVLAVLGKMPIMFPAAVTDPAQGFSTKPLEGPTVEFGHYLATSCSGCHGESYAGGPIPGGDPSWPAAANIRLGAIPAYTKESFTAMIRTGQSPVTGAALRPPMPVQLLQQLNEDEISALWAYLSTLK